ncbi:MAG: hypothetical protein ABI914_01740 [Acidobacteriota bacterium]
MNPGGAAAVLAALAVTWLTGKALTRTLARRVGFGEAIAWAGAAGLLFQAALFAILAALRVDPGAGWLLAGDAAAIAASFVFRSRPPTSPPAPALSPVPDPLALVLTAVAGFAWLVFLIAAVAEPMWSTDFLAIWGMKGKAMFLAGSLPGRLFQDPALYWSHREYPLLVPLCLASVARLAGAWNDQALAIVFPVIELWTLLLLGGFVRRRTGSSVCGAAAAALAALCFPLYHPVNAGTAEIPFAFGAVLVSCAALDSVGGSRVAAGRLFLAALFCAGAKQEGTLFAFVLAAALVLASNRPARATQWKSASLLVVVPAAQWLLLYCLRGSQTSRDFDFQLFGRSHWPELARRFESVLSRMLFKEGREAIVSLLGIGLFLLITRKGFADLLLAVLAGQIFFYAVAFSLSSFDPMYAMDAAFPRLATTLFPVLALILAARLPRPPVAQGAV